jgi:hypothetical protein
VEEKHQEDGHAPGYICLMYMCFMNHLCKVQKLYTADKESLTKKKMEHFTVSMLFTQQWG